MRNNITHKNELKRAAGGMWVCAVAHRATSTDRYDAINGERQLVIVYHRPQYYVRITYSIILGVLCKTNSLYHNRLRKRKRAIDSIVDTFVWLVDDSEEQK